MEKISPVRALRLKRLKNEKGTIKGDAPVRMSLAYPAPYHAAMSSLGLQKAYGAFNSSRLVCCERFFLPDRSSSGATSLCTYESGRRVSTSAVIAMSVSHELELTAAVRMLEMSSINPMRIHRDADDAPVIAGGSLTLVDPKLLFHLADAIVVGEAEGVFRALTRIMETSSDKEQFLEAASEISGVYIPALHGSRPPPPVYADAEDLPAKSVITTPDTELKNMFLVEAARGCPHRCAFCVAGGERRAPYRTVPMDDIIDAVVPHARRVGLVGAAVSNHPDLLLILKQLASMGVEVSVSSLRADRISGEIVHTLRSTGARSFTIAADGSSERLRKGIRKGISADDLVRAAGYARSAGFRRLKLYSMVGLPDESDRDLDEFIDLVKQMTAVIPVTVALQALVPKPSTPLADFSPVPVKEMLRKVRYVRSGLGSTIRFQSTSPRWSAIEHAISHSGTSACELAHKAVSEGGTMAAWKKVLAAHD